MLLDYSNETLMKRPFNYLSARRELVGAMLVAILAFASVWYYTAASNIHGDGKFHTLIAKEISEQDAHLEHMPHVVMQTGEQPVYFPINYPQTYHTVLATLYDYGGEAAVEMSSALFAALSALFLFLLLRRASFTVAVVAPVLIVLLNTPRFAMVPLMEQLLLATSMASLFALLELIRKPSWRGAVLLGVVAGLAASVKQQGLLIPAIVLPVLFVAMLVRFAQTKKLILWKHLVLSGAVMAVIVTPPLVDHIGRNGTIGYVPGTGTSGVLDSIPVVKDLINNKYPQDETAAALVRERIGYLTRDDAFAWQIALSFIGFPIHYSTITDFSGSTGLAVAVLGLLFVLGWVHIYRRAQIVAWILLAALVAEIGFTYVTQSRIEQYHIFGVAVAVPFVVAGIAWLASRVRPAAVSVLFVLALLTAFGFIYSESVHTKFYAHSGRHSNTFLNAYKTFAPEAQRIIGEEDIVLTPETNFTYYVDRDTTWLSSGGMPNVYTILHSSDENEAIHWLVEYEIDFVFIEWEQLSRSGLRDAIPASGLPSYIDTSAHFSEVHSYTSGEERVLSLYRVIP